MKKLYTLCAICALALPALAEEAPAPAPAENQTITQTQITAETQAPQPAALPAEPQKPKLKVSPSGRILVDAAAYTSNEKKDFPAGVAIPDARIGVKASYGKWSAKVDIGFGYGKVSLKDIFIQHTFNPSNLIRFGYFVHQFGLQSATSSSMKISMEEPTSNEIFNYPRLLGAMYVFDHGQFFATASLHAESKAMTLRSNAMGKTGYGGMTRLVWRPVTTGGNIAAVGFSFAAGSAQYNDEKDLNHKAYAISANFPTRVAQVNALGVTVDNIKAMTKFTPELLLAHNNLALESQYYWFNLSRHDGLPAYTAYGAYALLRWLPVGGNYKYSHADAGIATPGPKSLELVLGYNYTNASSNKAKLYGGRLNDVSLTANWYLNKYMIWRLRLAYTHRWDKTGAPDTNLGAIQTRFQISF